MFRSRRFCFLFSIILAVGLFTITQRLLVASAGSEVREGRIEQDAVESSNRISPGEASVKHSSAFDVGGAERIADRASNADADRRETGRPAGRRASSSLLFVENVGQFDSRARFQLVGSQKGTIYFAPDGIWLTLLEPLSPAVEACLEARAKGRRNAECVQVLRDFDREGQQSANIRLSLVGANPNPRVVGIDRLDTSVSYYLGNDPDQWYEDVPVYAGIRYENVYPGIDIEYTGVDGRWHSRIVADPDVDTSIVQLDVEGAEVQSIRGGKWLRLESHIGEVDLPLLEIMEGMAPMAPQMGQGHFVHHSKSVRPSTQRQDGEGAEVSEIGSLYFSTFLGGADGVDAAWSIAVDDLGYVYLTGRTHSTDFPATVGGSSLSGFRDAYVAKFSPDGQRAIYIAFLGGTDDDWGWAIEADRYGNAYVTGETDDGADESFPVEGCSAPTGTSSFDVFVAKFGPTGNLVFSTYFGGIHDEIGTGVDVDDAGDVYLAGWLDNAGSFIGNNVYTFSTPTSTYELNVVYGAAFAIKLSADDCSDDYAVFDDDLTTTRSSIAVDGSGNAYLATGLEVTSGDGDIQIDKLNSNGAAIYTTQIGGGGLDRANDIAVDSQGNAYVAGSTDSSDFPTSAGAYATSYFGGDKDAFIFVLDGSGDQIYGTFLGGSGWEEAVGIGVDVAGNLYLAGSTQSDDLRTTSHALSGDLQGGEDAFVAKLDPDGEGLEELLYATYLGGSDWDDGYGMAMGWPGTIYVSGRTASSDFPTTPNAYETEYQGNRDAFATMLVIGTPVAFGQDWQSECPVSTVSHVAESVGGPINTRSGNLSYQESDFSIPVQGAALGFSRYYASQAVDVYTTSLGHGWTHNFDMHLHFTNTAMSDTVEFQAPCGSRLPFLDNGDGTYTPYPGVTAKLAQVGSTYVITAFNQVAYTFDSNGLPLQQEDASGNIITFTHNAQGQLTQATQGTRSLTYAYDAATEYLTSVTDNLGRTVELGYESGDLVVVTDTLGLATTYHYSGTTHLLSEVVDPSGVTIEKTAYDSEGRAYRQWDGAGNLLVDIDFTITNTHVITESGVVMTHTYDNRGALIRTIFSCVEDTPGCGSGSGRVHAGNFRLGQFLDSNGNATSFDWDPVGSNLEEVTDAQGNVTSMDYDNFNNLTRTVDARGLTTTYAYENAAFPTFRTSMTDALGNTTVYTPTQTPTDTVDGFLKAERDPDGRVTTYTYNAFGQATEVVRAAGTADAVTTTYGYDAVGRLITTTETSAAESHTTLNVYDDGDRLIAAIANWTGSDPDQWEQDCATSPGERDTDVCTRYGYDDAGRTISTTNALGQTDLTFYDAAGRVVTQVTNYDGATPFSQLCTPGHYADPDPEDNVCSLTGYDVAGRVVSSTDSLGRVTRTFYNAVGRVAGTVENSVAVTASLDDCAFPPAQPDQDLCTLFEYDANGNAAIVTDPLGRQARMFYDKLNRMAGAITNWSGSITQTADLSTCFTLPVERDEDNCTLNAYDEVGNMILVTDTLGRMTRTFYDELNRVEGAVQNWQAGFALSDCFDPGLDAHRDENVCTLYGYDDAGNQITVTNALEQTSFTVYDAAGRPAIQVTNWNGADITIADSSACADATTDPDATENLCTFTAYDALGRRASTTDPAGNVTEYGYDGLGRVVTTTRYLDGQAVDTFTSYDALGNRLGETDANGQETTFAYDDLNRLVTTTSPEGVATAQAYDAAGRVLTTTDGLGHSATSAYDGRDRLLATTDPEGNTTQYEYDAAGNQVTVVDAEGKRTTYEYDGLDRLAGVVENDVGVTTAPDDCAFPPADSDQDVCTLYEYDAVGNRVVITNARDFTSSLTIYDGLNRPLTVIDALGNQTLYRYDLLGNRAVMTDGKGARTEYAYDDLNRLASTVYFSDSVTITYAYDVLGNRTVMTDDVGVTTYTYDDFSRLLTVTHPITGVVGYRYDDAGNRTQLIYPDGRSATYTYDGDNRLVRVDDWDAGATTYGYDGAGRLITTTLPNGVQSSYGYDDADRLVSLLHESGGGNTLAEYLYRVDGVGNRVVITETVAAPGTSAMAALPSGPDAAEVLAQVDERAFAVSAKPRPAGETVSSANFQAALAQIRDAAARLWQPLLAQQPGEVAELEIALGRPTLSADGRDTVLVAVLATDAGGRPVPDGTRVTLQVTGGRLSAHELETADGLAYARLQAGVARGRGRITARAGGASAAVDFHLQDVEEGVVRLDEGAQPGEEGERPFDVAELVERARNAIRVPDEGLPAVETPAHRAQFGAGRLHFAPAAAESTEPLSLTVELSEVAVGTETLFAGPLPAAALVEGNVARYERGQGLVEEMVARDAGVEQRWWLNEAPTTGGDLVVTVEVETALTLARAGTAGFVFRANNAETGAATAVAAYGRAVAIDANGRSLRADLSAETLPPSADGLNRYRLTMTFAGEWLAGAAYPLLVDPLVGSQLRLDGTTAQAGAQRRTAVAYNSADDEYLVVWEDDRESTTRIYGQRVSGDGVLAGNNFAVAKNNSNHYTAPDVAYNPDDNAYLVTWTSSSGQVMARTVSATGSLGSIKPLGEAGYSQNGDTAVTYSAAAGRWLVAWQRHNDSTNNIDVGARWVDNAGNVGSAFVVAEGSNDETAPDVAANDGGGFLVAWEEAAGGSYDLHARRTTTAAVDGNAFALTTADGAQVAPALTYNGDDGEYLAVWQDWSDGSGGSGYDAIWGQRVHGTAAGGTLAGSAFEVSGTEQADSALPAVTYYADGGSGGLYLVAWEQTVGGGALDLQARRVLTGGTTTGSVITLTAATGDQQEVALGFGPMAGDTLAIWIDERESDPDVYGRLVNADGTLEGDFLVHAAAGDQEAPQVAYNPDDDEYLAVWHDYRAGADNGDVYGQRVSGSGLLVGDNFTVTAAAYDQLYPQVAYAPGEDVYLVVWRGYITDTKYYDVVGQRLAGDGALVGSQLLVGDSDGELYRDGPSDAVYNSASNQFLVLWEERDAWARHVSVTGTMDSPVQVTAETGIEYGLRAAYNADDDQYLLVWEQKDPNAGEYNVLGRRMTGGGATMTETIDIASGTPDQGAPDVAYLSNAGRYAVVWQDARNSGTHGEDVYGQLVTPAGALDGTNFQVAGATQSEEAPRIEAGGQGGALVVWQRDNGGTAAYDLYGRRLDGGGQLSGDAFTVLEADDDQDQVALANGGDAFFLAWRDGRNGSADVYGSLFEYLQADFSASPTSGTAPLEVQFTDDYTPAGVADAWQWDFGDGGSSAAQHPVYTYTTAGTYTVTLVVTDTSTGESATLLRPAYIQVDEGVAVTQTTTVIHYDYDGLYRVTGTTYSGDITATYEYLYDAVGNMTAFTETVGTETTRVTRTFDAANRLETALDPDEGTTSYIYDDNGNLTDVYPPGSDAQNPVGVLHYDYDQRNLLITHTTYVSGTGWVLQAVYGYDGANSRLEQVDYTGASPVSIAYTNDIFGLTQVLVADDGTNQVYNLFGLDLISQDSDGEVRTLLMDGLGSVRLETAGGSVEAVTTYGPYGKVLSQSGTSGTVYGFTGEQEDSATGLLYLRARYYNASLKTFMSRDPWSGAPGTPQTMNGWSYVENNPFNRVDLTGRSSSTCPTCGPDATGWLMGEMARHYRYGVDIRNMKFRMMVAGSAFPGPPGLPGLPLPLIATESPFNEIVSAWSPSWLVLVNAQTARPVIGALGLLEFGLYGLAVDYSAVTYVSTGSSCGRDGGELDECGKFTPPDADPNTFKSLVTLCGRCIDSSDIGNMMFGLGGEARGYGIGETWAYAALFNELTGEPFLSPDARGAFPGYLVSYTGAYRNRATFCTLLNSMRIIGYNDAESREAVSRCAPCTTENVIRIGNKYTGAAPRANPSSLLRLSDNAPTIEVLNRMIGVFFESRLGR